MENLRRNRAIWIGLLLLGISAWGNLYPPFVMPIALVGATAASGLGVWFAYKRNTKHRGKLLALPGFAISVIFLGLITLTPILDQATKHQIEIAGLKRSYRVRTPASYDGSRPTPVILVFHGYNQTGYTIERLSRLDTMADREGFIVVYPEGYKRAWRTRGQPSDAVNDFAFAEQMVADIQARYSVDSSRVFAIGFSNGGSLALSLACDRHTSVRAIVAIGAGVREHHIARCTSPDTHPVPAMFINGTADRFVSWDRTRESSRQWAAMLNCETEAVVDTLPDTTNDGTRVWRERYDHCPNHGETILYAVEGAGHTWPNGGYQPRIYFGRTTRDFDSGEVISDFLHRVSNGHDRV